MRTIAFLAFMTMLWVAADTSLAHAQDASPRVQTEINDWLEDASVIRAGAQDTARLWQRDAPLLDARTDIFVAEAATFADVTETYAERLAAFSSSGDAAAMLTRVATAMHERLDALAAARAENTDTVVRVLSGMDRVVEDSLRYFGASAELQAQAETPAPIRVAYVTAPSQMPPAMANRTRRGR